MVTDTAGCLNMGAEGHTRTHSAVCCPGHQTPVPGSAVAGQDAQHGSSVATRPPGCSTGVRGRAEVVAGDPCVGTYHRIVDVLCLPQSLFSVFFAFSTFTFCKYDTQTDVNAPWPLRLTTDTRFSVTVTEARAATLLPGAFEGPEMEQGTVRLKPQLHIQGGGEAVERGMGTVGVPVRPDCVGAGPVQTPEPRGCRCSVPRRPGSGGTVVALWEAKQ